MKRMNLISLGFCFFAAVLLLRLCYLQVWCHAPLAAKADAQELYSVELEEFPRGRILDRHGNAITADSASFSLLVIPALVEDPTAFSERVGATAALSPSLLYRKIVTETDRGTTLRKEAFVAKSDLSQKEIDTLEALGEAGLFVISRQGRYAGDLPALHLIGALEKKDENTAVGVSGLERIYDTVLAAGGSRKLRFLVDEKNQGIRSDAYFEEGGDSSGAGSLATTIDLDIQRGAEAALGDRSGAVVVLDSKNADVLAMVSAPKYDPAHTAAEVGEDAYVNKALSAYPPASLMKIFLYAMALEAGKVAPETAFFCNGSYALTADTRISCWKKEGHGFLFCEDALGESCNPVAIKTATELGENAFRDGFSLWELDRDLLLGYPLRESSALELVENNATALANVALGENGVKMTPLNVAKMINVIATGGILKTPRVVTAVYDQKGEAIETFQGDEKRVLSEETAKIVTLMMKKTFETGTAKSLHLAELAIAGKTGTSETGNVWIGGFFPAEEPRYTVAILINDGTGGTASGGPVMKKLCAYLGNLP